MITKLEQQVYPEERSELRLIKQLLLTSSRKDHMTLKKPFKKSSFQL